MAKGPYTRRQKAPEVIAITGAAGDVTFQCPRCNWQVTLTPKGVEQWTQGVLKPRCIRDHIELIRIEH